MLINYFFHKKFFQVTSCRCHQARRCSEAPGGVAAAAVGLEEDDVGLVARWNLGLTPAWPRAPSPILWPCTPAEPLPLAPICLWPSPQLVPPQLLWDPKKARRRLAPCGCPQLPAHLPPPVAQARTGGSAQPRHCIFGVLLVWTHFGGSFPRALWRPWSWR